MKETAKFSANKTLILDFQKKVSQFLNKVDDDYHQKRIGNFLDTIKATKQQKENDDLFSSTGVRVQLLDYQEIDDIDEDNLDDQQKEWIRQIDEVLGKDEEEDQDINHLPNVYIDFLDTGENVIKAKREWAGNLKYWPGRVDEHDKEDRFCPKGTKSINLCQYLTNRTGLDRETINNFLLSFVSVFYYLEKTFGICWGDDPKIKKKIVGHQFSLYIEKPTPFYLPQHIFKIAQDNGLDIDTTDDWWSIYKLTLYHIELENWVYHYTDHVNKITSMPNPALDKLIKDTYHNDVGELLVDRDSWGFDDDWDYSGGCIYFIKR